MPTVSIILNVIFVLLVLGLVCGLCAWAVVTQHRDHGVVAEGSLMRRRIWSRTSRPHAGSVRPRPRIESRRAHAWPAA